MSDESRQEWEDLCVDSLTCELEADTETGEKPCIGCEDFAAASGEVTVEAVEDAIEELGALAETAMQTIDPLLQAEVNRQAEIHEKIAERLNLLDAAEVDEASLKADHKDAKACVETHKKALENLCRSLGTPPEPSLLDGIPELNTTHPRTEVTAQFQCRDCKHIDIEDNLLLTDDGSGYVCPNCGENSLVAMQGEGAKPDIPAAEATTEVDLDESGDDADTPEGDGGVDDL